MALLVRAKAIVTCDTDAPQNGITFEQLGLVKNAEILVDNSVIPSVVQSVIPSVAQSVIPSVAKRSRGTPSSGPSGRAVEGRTTEGDAIEVLDFPDCILVPGFVDAHAHPLFAGDRAADFAARQRGEKPPLGMRYTVERTREALREPDVFWHTIERRLHRMALHGTTTLETKTGYALTKAGELQLLDLIATHKDNASLPKLIATFLGAHDIPPEFADEEAYVDYLIAECLPEAAAHGAIYADAFCEPGFFSPHQTRRYLEAARACGLRLRLHCDEMQHGGAAEMASERKVDAVDHCNDITTRDVDRVVESGAVMVACPATINYLNLPKHAPVRAVLERGGTVAIASDYNPGTSPCFNLQTVAYYARSLFGLSAAEALHGVTVAAAKSLHVNAGRLRAGDPADFVLLQLESTEAFGAEFGGNLAEAVFRSGTRIA